MDQVRQYNPPPNPTKFTDSRASVYVQEYGDESWELDALEPSALIALIENQISGLINREPWNAAEMHDADAKRTLRTIASRYEDVVEFLEA